MMSGRRVSSLGANALKYWAIGVITAKSSLAYITDTVLRQVFLVVIIFTFSQLWSVTYRVTGQSTIAGFSVTQMLWYLVLTEAITLGQVRAAAAMDDDVKSGQIAYTLSRPYNFILYHYATYIGETLVRVPANIILGGAVAALTVGLIRFPIASVLVGTLSIVLGTTLHFVVSAGIGLLAFWFEETQSFYLLYSRVALLLGGVMLPLELMPAPVQRVAAVLPTRYMIYDPARIFTGHVQASGTAPVFLRQVAWIAVFSVVLNLVYRQGVKHASVQGG
jgi:ABC-2 type transport system permease protein